jgi:ABC-type branched-subunit amino acid transport system substrate-binding protein
VSLSLGDWNVPTIANSALIYGYHSPDWAKGWEGWVYPDTVSDTNQRYVSLCQTAAASGRTVGPGAAGAYDMGRLLAEGIARARYLTRDEVVAGLERVKSLPAATGQDGTLMGFGRWDRAALKGRFLVLREWRDGQSKECEDQG